LKAASTTQLCLADEVIYNVMDEEMATDLWSRLEILYMTKSPSNNKFVLEENIIWATHEARDNSIGASELLQKSYQ